MPPRRTEHPWGLIHLEVDAAVKAFAKSDFVSTKQLAKYVIENSPKYPLLANTQKCTTSRITMSVRKRNWVSWSSEKDGGRQKVFVIPEGVRG